MTSLLATFLVVAVVPLFTASWRWSFFGLFLQGALLGAIAWKRGALHEPSGLLLLADYLVLRAFVGPRVLWRVLSRQVAAPQHDIMPANLLFWTLTLVILLVSFSLGSHLEPDSRVLQMGVTVPAAALLLGFLVLAARNTTLGQVIGVLRIENAIALFEVGGGRHQPLVVQVALTAIYAALLVVLRYFVAHPPPAAGEGTP